MIKQPNGLAGSEAVSAAVGEMRWLVEGVVVSWTAMLVLYKLQGQIVLDDDLALQQR